MIHGVFLTLVAIPSTHPIIAEMIFEERDMELAVEIRLDLDIRPSHVLFWIMFVTKGDDNRIRPV